MSEYTECPTNAEKIARWRDSNPGERLTARTVETIIGVDLRDADLRCADLQGADLRCADLGDADLQGADLWDANLRDANLLGADLRYARLLGADLRGAGLWDANLRDAILRDANLRGSNLWGGFRLDGLPSGQVTMVPTSDGWHLRVGCWGGTIDDLEALARGDDDWPEAEGEERERRRPGLLALIPVLRAHAEYHHHQLVAVREKWGDEDQHEKAMRRMGETDE